MLAYAANRPVAGARSSSPHSILIIFAAHVAALALLMSAKTDVVTRIIDPPIHVVPLYPEVIPPPQQQPQAQQHPRTDPTITRPTTPIPLPQSPDPAVDVPIPTLPEVGPIDPGPLVGDGVPVNPRPQPTPAPRVGPRLLTSPAELKPPYPQSKLLAEEEADLRLRLTIDDRGRVRTVDPIGRTDAEFLAAARRYLIAHWRYQPASEGGRAVGSTIDITLRFRLDG